MAGYGDFSPDFSIIGNLPQTYQQGQVTRARRSLADLAPGDFAGQSRALLQAGDIEGARSLAQLADQAQQRAFDERRLKLAEEAQREKPKVEFHPNAQGDQVPYRITPTGEVSLAPVSGQQTAPTNPYSQGKMTEGEAKAGLFGERLASAHNTITKFENIYSGPTGQALGAAEKMLPEGAFNMMAGADQQQMMNAKRSFVNSLLRRESGAAIGAGEFKSYDKEYFPQPGDSPQVIEQKRLHRQEVTEGLFREAGSRFTPPKDYVSRQEAQGTPAAGNYSGAGQWGAPYRSGGGAPAVQGAAPQGGPLRVGSKAEYDALPRGSQYVAPDGSLRTKQ